ncbi:MAG: hypothetical protein Q4C66_00350 [Lachnospiraceae bacterium]|nr:hypothetical protein [Lachnospiraceae bacterium]
MVTNGVGGASGCSQIGEAGHFRLLHGCGCSLAGCIDKAIYR